MCPNVEPEAKAASDEMTQSGGPFAWDDDEKYVEVALDLGDDGSTFESGLRLTKVHALALIDVLQGAVEVVTAAPGPQQFIRLTIGGKPAGEDPGARETTPPSAVAADPETGNPGGGLVSPEERVKLAHAFELGVGRLPDDGELTGLIDWMAHARASYLLSEAVLMGDLEVVRADRRDPLFRGSAAFRASPYASE
jgi:hypothetical protein